MTKLTDLPHELLLEISRRLELPDPICFLMTCKSFYQLSIAYPTFWLQALQTASKSRPLNLSFHTTDFSVLSYEDLRNIALGWMRWTRAIRCPSLPRSVRRMQPLEGRMEIIYLVSGTDIVVVDEYLEHRLWCCDVATGEIFPFESIEDLGYLFCISEPYETKGVHKIALASTNEPMRKVSLQVVTIEHENKKATNFYRSFLTTALHFSELSAFIYDDVIGYLGQTSTFDSTLTIRSINLTTNEARTMQTDVPQIGFPVLTSFSYRGHLYNIIETKASTTVESFSRVQLPYSQIDQSAVRPIDAIRQTIQHSNTDIFCINTPSDPAYGLTACLVRQVLSEDPQDDNVISTRFIFLLNDFERNVASETPSPGFVETREVTLEGCVKNRKPSLVWLDHSGSAVLVLMDSPTSGTTLNMIKRSGRMLTTQSITVDADLESITNVAVDESIGIIYLVGRLGQITCLEYV